MRFICDNTLGKLTKYLRILGFDTVSLCSTEALNKYRHFETPPLFFTRKMEQISYKPTVCIRTNSIEEQIREIENIIRPHVNSGIFMTRCIECNTILASVRKEDVEARVPEYVYHHHRVFRICPSCDKVYWEGTHAANIRKWTGALKQQK